MRRGWARRSSACRRQAERAGDHAAAVRRTRAAAALDPLAEDAEPAADRAPGRSRRPGRGARGVRPARRPSARRARHRTVAGHPGAGWTRSAAAGRPGPAPPAPPRSSERRAAAVRRPRRRARAPAWRPGVARAAAPRADRRRAGGRQDRGSRCASPARRRPAARRAARPLLGGAARRVRAVRRGAAVRRVRRRRAPSCGGGRPRQRLFDAVDAALSDLGAAACSCSTTSMGRPRTLLLLGFAAALRAAGPAPRGRHVPRHGDRPPQPARRQLWASCGATAPVERIALRGLAAGDVAELARVGWAMPTWPAPSTPRTGGNAFFVEEVLRGRPRTPARRCRRACARPSARRSPASATRPSGSPRSPRWPGSTCDAGVLAARRPARRGERGGARRARARPPAAPVARRGASSSRTRSCARPSTPS